MALSVSQSYTTDEDVFAEFRFRVVDITLDNNYPAGGYVGGRALVGMSQALFALIPLMRLDGLFPYLLAYDITTDKIHMYNPSTQTEYAGGTSFAGVAARCLAIGK